MSYFENINPSNLLGTFKNLSAIKLHYLNYDNQKNKHNETILFIPNNNCGKIYLDSKKEINEVFNSLDQNISNILDLSNKHLSFYNNSGDFCFVNKINFYKELTPELFFNDLKELKNDNSFFEKLFSNEKFLNLKYDDVNYLNQLTEKILSNIKYEKVVNIKFGEHIYSESDQLNLILRLK